VTVDPAVATDKGATALNQHDIDKSRWGPTQSRSESLEGEGQSGVLRAVLALTLETQPSDHGEPVIFILFPEEE